MIFGKKKKAASEAHTGVELRSEMAQVILATEVKCMDCADKIQKALKKVPGVHSVEVSIEAGLVAVEGTADAEALRARLQARVGKRVPVTIVSNGEVGTSGPAEASPRSFILKMDLHCEDCARKVKKKAMKIPGVKEVTTYWAVDQVVVTGTADASTVATRLGAKSRRPVTVVSDPRPATSPPRRPAPPRPQRTPSSPPRRPAPPPPQRSASSPPQRPAPPPPRRSASSPPRRPAPPPPRRSASSPPRRPAPPPPQRPASSPPRRPALPPPQRPNVEPASPPAQKDGTPLATEASHWPGTRGGYNIQNRMVPPPGLYPPTGGYHYYPEQGETYGVQNWTVPPSEPYWSTGGYAHYYPGQGEAYGVQNRTVPPPQPYQPTSGYPYYYPGQGEAYGGAQQSYWGEGPPGEIVNYEYQDQQYTDEKADSTCPIQ